MQKNLTPRSSESASPPALCIQHLTKGYGTRLISAHQRAAIENEIERLVAILDEVDGSSDYEACGDNEPSLGWTIYGGSAPATDDREIDWLEAAA